MVPRSALAVTPRGIYRRSWDDLRAEIPAPLGGDLLPVPLLEGKTAQRLLDEDRVLPSAPTARPEGAVPVVAYGVEPFEDGGEQGSVGLPSGGGAQHVLALPAALDRRDEFAHRRLAAAHLQAFEFAAEGKELFVGVFFVVQHVGNGGMEGVARGRICTCTRGALDAVPLLLGYASKNGKLRREGVAPSPRVPKTRVLSVTPTALAVRKSLRQDPHPH